jgi:hypothetical protein
VLLLLVYEVDEVANAFKDRVDLVARQLPTTALLQNCARDITQRCLLRLHVSNGVTYLMERNAYFIAL